MPLRCINCGENPCIKSENHYQSFEEWKNYKRLYCEL